MRQINVEGMPDHIVCILQTMIHALRNNRAIDQERAKTAAICELSRIPGTAIGTLSRRDIYEGGYATIRFLPFSLAS